MTDRSLMRADREGTMKPMMTEQDRRRADTWERGAIARALGAAIAFALALCAVPETHAASTDVTYHGKIGRLIRHRCQQCHYPGGIGPFDAGTYESFIHGPDSFHPPGATLPPVVTANFIKDRVVDRVMPPWNANIELNEYEPPPVPSTDEENLVTGTFLSGIGDHRGYLENRGLTTAERNLFAQWVNSGFPEGDPSDALPPPPPPTGDIFSIEYDRAYQLPVEFTLPAGVQDIYRCFVVPAELTVDRVVTDLEFVPTNPTIAHHSILFLDIDNLGPARDAMEGSEPNDGWTCYGDPDLIPGDPGAGLAGVRQLGGWAPGGNLQPFNEFTGTTIPAGSNIIVQMHYSGEFAGGVEQRDQTRFAVKFAPIGAPNIELIQIPPARVGDLGTIMPHSLEPRSLSFVVPSNIHLTSVFPHMHLIGQTIQAVAKFPGGGTTTLANLDRWDFNWQNYYVYKKPIPLPRNTVVEFTGWYNNTTDDPVTGGFFSADEMLFLGLGFTVDELIPGSGIPAGSGTPPTFDYIPPTISGFTNTPPTFPGGPSSFTIEFSEQVHPPAVPAEIDFRTPGGTRIVPQSTSFDGDTFTAYFNGLPAQNNSVVVNAFFGIRDMTDNFLDTTADGVGGTLADDTVLTMSTFPPYGFTRQPADQVVNEGRDVWFGVKIQPAIPATYQWYKSDFLGTREIDGETQATLKLNDVSNTPNPFGADPYGNSGFYHCVVESAQGTLVSRSASLSIFDEAQFKPYQANFVKHTVPSEMIRNQQAPVSFRFRNIGMVSMAQPQGVGLKVVSDPAGFFGGATIIPFADPLDVISIGSGQYSFPAVIKAPPADGSYSFSVQLTDQVTGAMFGPVVTVTVIVGSSLDIDFANATDLAGWLSGVLSGRGGTGIGAQGLCMEVPADGNNIVAWVSPEDYIPLTDRTLYEVILDVYTDQTGVNKIPLWNLLYNNYNADGTGNNFGGESGILDVAGGANGIGRANGRTQFKFYIAPNAVDHAAWRGLVNPGSSAFSAAADASNDISLLFRVLDLASAGVNSIIDEGTVCVRRLRVRAISMDALGVNRIWGPPITTGSFLPQNDWQQAQGAGTAVINNGAQTANYALLSGNPGDSQGKGARKSLFPYDAGQPNYHLQLFPITWNDNELLRGTMMIRSNINGGAGPAGSDPVDLISIAFDTTTVEVIQTQFTTRGSPGNMLFAASPLLTPQPYRGFFFTQNATDYTEPDSRRLRMFGDFFNSPVLAPQGVGADPFAIVEMYVDRITLP